MSELGKQKNGAEGEVDARERAATAALGACRTKGRGWTRIRRVRDRSQRNAYARGAKELWRNLGEVAVEGAWVEVYAPYLRALPAPLRHAAVGPGARGRDGGPAPAARLQPAAYSFGNCATFKGALKKVRQFKVGGEPRRERRLLRRQDLQHLVRYVSDRQRAAARAHWGSRDDAALEAARTQLKALGGDEGYANYFAFAFRG